MADEKRIHLKEIDTTHKVEVASEYVWSVVTENNHLLLEIDLNGDIGFSKERNNRKIASYQGEIIVRRPEGSYVIPKFQLQLHVIEKQLCDYCRKQIAAGQAHEPYMVHNHCWPQYLKAHPEVTETGPIDD